MGAILLLVDAEIQSAAALYKKVSGEISCAAPIAFWINLGNYSKVFLHILFSGIHAVLYIWVIQKITIWSAPSTFVQCYFCPFYIDKWLSKLCISTWDYFVLLYMDNLHSKFNISLDDFLFFFCEINLIWSIMLLTVANFPKYSTVGIFWFLADTLNGLFLCRRY